jgi:hypothetical protein
MKEFGFESRAYGVWIIEHEQAIPLGIHFNVDQTKMPAGNKIRRGGDPGGCEHRRRSVFHVVCTEEEIGDHWG